MTANVLFKYVFGLVWLHCDIKNTNKKNSVVSSVILQKGEGQQNGKLCVTSILKICVVQQVKEMIILHFLIIIHFLIIMIIIMW